MQIQARLYFTSDDVTCVPVDPALSQYQDRIGLADPAFEFRMRLFSARVSKASLTACVALVLPPDLVTRNEGHGPASAPDAPIPPVAQRGSDESLSLIVLAGTPDRPFELWVDNSTVHDVIGFARQHGVYPVALVVPTLEGEETITVPIENEAPPPPARVFGQAQARTDSIRAEIPPAVLRELEKRKQQEARNAARSAKNAPTERVFAQGGKDEAAAMALAARITATLAGTVEPVARQFRGRAAPRGQDASLPDAGLALPDRIDPSIAADLPQGAYVDGLDIGSVADPFVSIPSAEETTPAHHKQHTGDALAMPVTPVVTLRPGRDVGLMAGRVLEGLRYAALVPVHPVARTARAAAGGVRRALLGTALGLCAMLSPVRGSVIDATRELRRVLQPGLDAVSVIFLRPVMGAAGAVGIVATGAVVILLPLFAPEQAEIRMSDAASVPGGHVRSQTRKGRDRIAAAMATHVPVAVAIAREEPAPAPLPQPESSPVVERAPARAARFGPGRSYAIGSRPSTIPSPGPFRSPRGWCCARVRRLCRP